jgi:iron complex transport system permease protein
LTTSFSDIHARNQSRSPLRGNRRGAFGLAVGAVVLLVALTASLVVGVGEILPLPAVAKALVAFSGSKEELILIDLRLPRLVLGLLVGLALGAAGALLQGLTRNPLADPGVLGIEWGAALAVVLAIFVLHVESVAVYVWFAFAGAALAGLLVVVLGGGMERPVRLVLAGSAVTVLAAAIGHAVLVSDARSLDAFRYWAVGSVAGRRLDVGVTILPFVTAGLALTAVSGTALNALSMGEEVATSLGQRVAAWRGLVALAIVLLAGSAVAAAGPIAFVGLVVAHLARALVGPDYRWLTLYAMLGGALLVVGADVVGRVLARPGEVQTGVVTALIGAPLFVGLAARPRAAKL